LRDREEVESFVVKKTAARQDGTIIIVVSVEKGEKINRRLVNLAIDCREYVLLPVQTLDLPLAQADQEDQHG